VNNDQLEYVTHESETSMKWRHPGVWHSGWAFFGVMLSLVAGQTFTLAGVSLLTKPTEEQLKRDMKSARMASQRSEH
jgi:hypothetical protein